MSEKENNVVTTQETQPKVRRSPWAILGLCISIFAVLILIAGFSFGYFALSKVNWQLVHAFKNIETQLDQDHAAFMQAKKDIETLKQSAEKSDQVAKQLEKINADLQGGNFSKWYLAEAEYLTNLANDEVQFTHHFTLALALLQRADQVLQNVNDASLLELRKAIANNIATLQGTPEVDVTTIYSRLSALDQQIDELQLPQTPLNANANTTQTAENNTANESWWQQSWHRTWDALKKVVIVRRIANDKLPFVMPDEKFFLYQNMHVQMQIAMWALLNHNETVYQNSLNRINEWIKKYFDLDAANTKAVLQNIDDAQKINIARPTLNFADTLKLFHTSSSTDENNTAHSV